MSEVPAALTRRAGRSVAQPRLHWCDTLQGRPDASLEAALRIATEAKIIELVGRRSSKRPPSPPGHSFRRSLALRERRRADALVLDREAPATVYLRNRKVQPLPSWPSGTFCHLALPIRAVALIRRRRSR